MSSRTSSPANSRARKFAIDLSIMTVIGVVLAFIGPFGSFDTPLPVRLVSWVSFAYIGYAIYSPMGWVVNRLKAMLDLPGLGLWLFAVLVGTVPMTAVVWMVGFVPRLAPLPTLDQALTSYFYVLLVGGAVTAFFYTLETRALAARTEALAEAERASAAAQGFADVPVELPVGSPAKPASSNGGRFIDRLPPELGNELIALEMEDHYVRAHTVLGSDLVLMRLRDALAELDGLEGMQVHRSWWVARHSVQDVKRAGRNVRLTLEGGLEAPVSRANVQPLKDAGWI